MADGTLYFWMALSLRVISALGESIAVPASYPLGRFVMTFNLFQGGGEFLSIVIPGGKQDKVKVIAKGFLRIY